VLLGQPVTFRLIRARRRSIGMVVDRDGLTVRAPGWVSVREIDLALRERARWILDMLVEWVGRGHEALPASWVDGASILYQGRQLTLLLAAARDANVEADLVHLLVRHPAPDDGDAIGTLVLGWLREQALAQATRSATLFARRLGRAQPSVSLTGARTLWGTCAPDGQIRVNWRLVQVRPPLLDYVVAHEMAHLIEPNHSSRFWAQVERLLPGHAALRAELDDITPLL
jgi:predicted metal-dependent hydrolase